jgi:hypothetical protein
LEIYLQRSGARTGKAAPLAESVLRAFKRASPFLTPFFVWGYWFAVAGGGSPWQPLFSLRRIPIVFLSVHLRAYHWLADTPWRSGIRDGLAALVHPVGLSALAVLLLLVGVLLRRSLRDQAEGGQLPVLESLVLAWGLFAGSRLVFILQGGIATHTRHNYGAAMGAAVAGAAVMHWLCRRLKGSPRIVVGIQGLTGVGLACCVLCCIGIGVHYRETTRAEEVTFQALLPFAKQLPAGSNIVVTGDPTGTKGELPFYSELDGLWLRARLKPHAPGVQAYVVPTVEYGGSEIRLPLHNTLGKTELRLPRDMTQVFEWRGRHLLRHDAHQPGEVHEVL